MSSGRANASAIQRRTATGGGGQNPGRVSFQAPPQQQQQQQQQNYNNGRNQPPPQMAHPKLSVSDAIALITLRLGKVETFINTLPPLDQLELYSAGSGSSSGLDEQQERTSNDNMRIVDEAVFKSIVTRLDRLERLEQNNIEKERSSSKQIEDLKTLVKEQILIVAATPPPIPVSVAEVPAPVQVPVIDNASIEELKAQVKELQSLLLNLQSYTMSTNKKLCDIVFCNEVDENDNDDNLHHNLSLHLSQLLSGSIADEHLVNCVNELNDEFFSPSTILEEESLKETTIDTDTDEQDLSINI